MNIGIHIAHLLYGGHWRTREVKLQMHPHISRLTSKHLSNRKRGLIAAGAAHVSSVLYQMKYAHMGSVCVRA